MAAEGVQTLQQTPTWAVAIVCLVLVTISIIIEHAIHLIGKWLTRKNKRTLYEALERIKSELMLLGFISLLLTVGTAPITEICISKSLGDTWLPFVKQKEEESQYEYDEGQDDKGQHRRLLSFLASTGSHRRVLAAALNDKCTEKRKVPFLSADGLHELHIFIFVLAVFHVLCSIISLALGRAKVPFSFFLSFSEPI